MKKTVAFFIVLILWCIVTATAQKNIIEMGPATGVSMPVMKQRNPDYDRPSAGAMFGFKADLSVPLYSDKWYVSAGTQACAFYFSNSPLRENQGTAVKLFGYSFGLPLQLHKLFLEEEHFAFRASGGIIPIIETSALVRTDVPDGGLRFNIAPEAAVSIILDKRHTVGFSWFMPLLLYGAKSRGDTFRLHNFSFTVTYCPKERRF